MVIPARAQHAGVKFAELREELAPPVSKPEPQKRIADDPRRIFQRIISRSAADRQAAAKQLAWDSAEFVELDDARLLLTNLDSDEDQEIIFILSGSPVGTVALVLDQQKDGWKQVGKFDYSWHWDSNQAEKLIELREIVRSGQKDIIVRTRSGGTGVDETELTIFRMHEGKLYRIFRTLENAEYTICCGIPDSGSFVEEARAITFPRESVNEPYIVVRHTRTKHPPENTSKQPVRPRSRVSCTVFKWTPQPFVFLEDKTAAPELCAGK